MSILGRLRSVGRFCRSIVLALGILLVAPIVSAGPQLWLYPQDSGPREGGHMVPPGGFTLVIENRSKASDDNTVLGVELVVAVNNPASITSLSVTKPGDLAVEIENFVNGTPELPCSNKPMARHGVYPTYYTTVLLGDLPGGQLFEVDVVAEGGDKLRVHFDAIGIASKTNRNGEKCFDVSNPAGHDVTVGRKPGGGHDDCGRVKITKTADQKFFDVGETVTFEIEIINEGSCELTDPILRDFIPSVEDKSGETFPAFTVIGGSAPLPDPADDYLLEWTLESPLPAGEQDGAWIDVEINPAADGQRVVNRACLSAEELRKPRCAAAVIIVGNPNGDDGPAGPGFWCHAVRFILEDRRNAPYDAEDFEEWLADIGEGVTSLVFHEPYDASTLELAQGFLCSPQSALGPADRLVRHLLTLWLNVASGRLALGQELDELCDGDELMPAVVEPETVVALIADVEAALLDSETDDQTLTYWSEVVDAVNNSLVPGEPGCMAPLTTSGRQRTGRGNPGGKLAVVGN